MSSSSKWLILLEADAWTTLPAGEGAKGLRLYDWARVVLPWPADESFERWLLDPPQPKGAGQTRLLPRLCARGHRSSPNWLARPACAGRSRNASSAPRTISASTIAKRAPGTAGIAI